MADMTNYLENAIGNHVLRGVALTSPTALYLALYTAAPTEAGGGTEVTGGSYARKQITFNAPTDGAFSQSNDVEYANMPAVTVVAVAVLDALTAGNMLYYKAITSIAVGVGETFRVPAGTITITHQ